MVNPTWPHPTANNTLAQYWGDGPNVVADLCTHYLRLTKSFTLFMSRIMSKNKRRAQTQEAWIQDCIYGTTGVVRYDCNTIKVLIVQLIKGYYS